MQRQQQQDAAVQGQAGGSSRHHPTAAASLDSHCTTYVRQGHQRLQDWHQTTPSLAPTYLVVLLPLQDTTAEQQQEWTNLGLKLIGEVRTRWQQEQGDMLLCSSSRLGFAASAS
jgi:hypothetical protein